jgi:hypothetical protein
VGVQPVPGDWDGCKVRQPPELGCNALFSAEPSVIQSGVYPIPVSIVAIFKRVELPGNFRSLLGAPPQAHRLASVAAASIEFKRIV